MIALGAIGTPSLEPMLAELEEPDAKGQMRPVFWQILAIRKLHQPLTKNLTDWASSPMVGAALEKLNWQHIIVLQTRRRYDGTHTTVSATNLYFAESGTRKS